MTHIKQNKLIWALFALALIFAACKSESPTTPTPGNGGGVPPPTGSSVTLNVSNSAPQVNSSVTITATVTQGGSPVPNGTAVEFSTTLGTFADTNTATTIRTTTNGVATAVLTSGSAGTATITVVVNNVNKTTSVTFSVKPVIVPPDTAPAITSITPATGRPQGGEQISILGKNFRTPLRVLFDVGSGAPKEGFIVSSTLTQIVVLTPAINLGPNQQSQTANVSVVVESGTPNEITVTQSAGFRFQLPILTPSIITVSPASGPVEGGTRITIIGENFQAPVQVTFGGPPAATGGALTFATELQVVDTQFNQIIAVTPAFRSTDPTLTAGQVTLRVLNIGSAKDATMPAAFRYLPRPAIAAVGPTEGPYTGGTRVQIDGVGFVDPVAVVIGGVAAQPISVSGTRVIAITSPVVVTACSDIPGPVSVTNIDAADTAPSSIVFTYRVPKAAIINVSPPSAPVGGNVSVTVANAGAGTAKFVLGTIAVFPSSVVVNANGSTTYTMVVPNGFTFPTAACVVGGVAGTIQQNLLVNVVFTNLQTTCTDTALNAFSVAPAAPACTVAPVPTPPSATLVLPASGTLIFGTTPVGTPATGTIRFANSAAGSAPLTVSGAAISGANAADFTIVPVGRSIPNGCAVPCGDFTVTFTPNPPPGPSTRIAQVAFATNDPLQPTIVVQLRGTTP